MLNLDLAKLVRSFIKLRFNPIQDSVSLKLLGLKQGYLSKILVLQDKFL